MSADVVPFPVRTASSHPSGVFWESFGAGFCGPCQLRFRKPEHTHWRRVRLANPAHALKLHCSRCSVWVVGSRELHEPFVYEANFWERLEVAHGG